jgi:SRSO17 transposase
MVYQARMRWRIERDDQDLKQDLGLGHYAGRNWRGFHHHASLVIAACGGLRNHVIQRKKRCTKPTTCPYPRIGASEQSSARSATSVYRLRSCRYIST